MSNAERDLMEAVAAKMARQKTIGGIVGAAGGAIIGSNISDEHPMIGGVAMGAAGYAIGKNAALPIAAAIASKGL